jgi:hypothetical protein
VASAISLLICSSVNSFGPGGPVSRGFGKGGSLITGGLLRLSLSKRSLLVRAIEGNVTRASQADGKHDVHADGHAPLQQRSHRRFFSSSADESWLKM